MENRILRHLRGNQEIDKDIEIPHFSQRSSKPVRQANLEGEHQPKSTAQEVKNDDLAEITQESITSVENDTIKKVEDRLKKLKKDFETFKDYPYQEEVFLQVWNVTRRENILTAFEEVPDIYRSQVYNYFIGECCRPVFFEPIKKKISQGKELLPEEMEFFAEISAIDVIDRSWEKSQHELLMEQKHGKKGGLLGWRSGMHYIHRFFSLRIFHLRGGILI